LLQVVGDGLKLCVKVVSGAVQGVGSGVGVVVAVAGAFTGLAVLVLGLGGHSGVVCMGSGESVTD